MVRDHRSDQGDRDGKPFDSERTPKPAPVSERTPKPAPVSERFPKPAPVSERFPKPVPESERGPRSSPRRKVMVIDDSVIVLEATKGMLRSAGFDVVTCESPIGATLRVVHEKPDVVLVDLDMGSMGGDRLIMMLKQGPRTADIPVFLYTGQNARVAEEAVRRSKADGFIPKSCDPLLLAYAIRRALAR